MVHPSTCGNHWSRCSSSTAWTSCSQEHVYERVHAQHGIYYFTERASGELRPSDLARSAITDKGFDIDRSFMLIEIAGDDMYFQTISRSGDTSTPE